MLLRGKGGGVGYGRSLLRMERSLLGLQNDINKIVLLRMNMNDRLANKVKQPLIYDRECCSSSHCCNDVATATVSL